MTPTLFQRYVVRQFVSVFFVCLFGATSLFIIFDLFERMKLFLGEDTPFFLVCTYLFFKLPLTIHVMLPVATLIATLVTIGRLSQQTEITAMRACGVSLIWLARPLILIGFLLSLIMFVAGETIVPWAAERVEETYHFDIKKKIERGAYDRSDFWYRSGKAFVRIHFYESRSFTLHGLSLFELSDTFQLTRRTDAERAIWKGPEVGWSMENVVETVFLADGRLLTSNYRSLPFVADKQPADFFDFERTPEALSYQGLKRYAEKLRSEGVPVSSYEVQLAAKIAFPLVNVILVLVAFPFSLNPARAGTMTVSFIAGVAIGFGYYVVHAFSISLGAAELIPPTIAAWTANLILGCIAAFMLVGAERP